MSLVKIVAGLRDVRGRGSPRGTCPVRGERPSPRRVLSLGAWPTAALCSAFLPQAVCAYVEKLADAFVPLAQAELILAAELVVPFL